MTDQQGDPETAEHGASSGGDTADPADSRYKRRIGVTLALLAILGAWIAVMQTDAGTNESTDAREATRQAVEAQSADVLAKGLQTGIEKARAEVEALGSRAVFSDPVGLGEALGIEVDPRQAGERLETADAAISGSFDGPGPDVTALVERAKALSLQQKATVDTRITWNAKASQYETVLTVLAIAIFLVGFTLVIGRRQRPPIAVPGVLLALFCAGWVGVIWSHTVPYVPSDSIKATAAGQTALGEGRSADAHADFSEALDAKPDYVPALRGRALATLLETNPDLLNTLAVTDRSAATVDPAVADILAAIDAGGDQDPQTLAVAALATTLGGQWERAETLLDDAIELNENATELYLWHAVVDIAQGQPDGAQDWLDRAKDRFGDLGPDRVRAAVAQYLSLLEVVGEKEPDQADLAKRFAQQAVASATASAVDRPLDPSASPDVTFEVVQADFDDNSTTLKFTLDGTEDDTAIAIVGYERPSADAAWVQPAELFYAGPAAGRGEGVSIDTPRACAPVEYRFDLYVEGEFVSSATAPGAGATC
jgi:tetratricopeptide (TPR) repeat protein